MTTQTTRIRPARQPYSTDDQRWQAVVDRDAAADGQFYFSVKTTGVFCRPGCPARVALRKHVRFHDTSEEALRAGFRPCRRCRPTAESPAQLRAATVAQACRLIETAAESPTLGELAKSAGLSSFHFQRVFKAQTGVTPKDYAAAQRARRVRGTLAQSATITQALYAAGFQSSGRFYETSTKDLGMTPKQFRAGGSGTTIRFAVGQCWLGSILVAATDRGVCAILLGDHPDALISDLQDRFPQAELSGGNEQFERLVAIVIGFVERPSAGIDLPLDMRGTAFQLRVWKALRGIPAGSTASYQEIARQIGRPRSARAVGQAIAANPLAVAIPCHRVIRKGGALSGYRWGVVRKDRLLQREAGERVK